MQSERLNPRPLGGGVVLQHYVVSPAVVDTTLGGEAVILNGESSDYFMLNEAGSMIWSGIRDGLTFDAIVQLLSESYDVDQENARTDVNDLIHNLVEARILIEN
jgi:hypothetical protein